MWRERSLGDQRRAGSLAILDSQSVKSAAEGDVRGFHAGKKVKGRSRHVAVDSQGSLLAVRVMAASASDSTEASAVMAQAVAHQAEMATPSSPTRVTDGRPAPGPPGLGVTSSSSKRAGPAGLRPPGPALGRRAHLRLARPVPPPVQGLRKNGRLRGSLLLASYVSPATTPLGLAKQLLRARGQMNRATS